MRWITECPAKLNLFLAVAPPDERGWHPLRTIFQSIDLYDSLSIEVSERDSFRSDAEYLPNSNTVTTALQILRRHREFPPLSITLEKRIPAQSGLGGGSSDAAGLIRMVSQIWIRDLSPKTLMEIALRVGADVPFFLIGGQAKAEGYGELLTPLPDQETAFYVVVKPRVDCSTPEMFRALDLLTYPWQDFPEDPLIYNDFERVMPETCRGRINQLLLFGAASAGLSGSGSAVFGVFESHTEALTAKELIVNSGEESVWVTQSIGRKECLKISSFSD